MAELYNLISENDESTVVAQYKIRERRSDSYQSEAALEKAFIEQLQEQGYDYLPINDETALIANLRAQLERLNHITFTDKEWDTFLHEDICNPKLSIPQKTHIIQEDHIRNLRREDGSVKNIYLIDKVVLANNRLQVINQYQTSAPSPLGEGNGERLNRYDVTILVNGLPLVHIELKRRGVAIKEAFNQINRYQRDSFWVGSGLYNYVQMFVISNGTETKYYSNTTRFKHVWDNRKYEANPNRNRKIASNSFEFTSYWADRTNKIIPDLVDFTATFFNRLTLLQVLTKYCVMTVDEDLLVMRPYQISATEAILQRILTSSNRKDWGRLSSGGYIWHTTGSGKTLTSFKTARLASRMEGIDKVMFVVDRKDLDYQTMREYDRFEKGAANSSKNTTQLKKNIEDPNCHILITTIQKLAIFVQKNAQHPIYNQHVVIIFDECHRSQFGEMHAAIVKRFKRYHLFGFTGTPIFAENAGAYSHPEFCTTEQAFGDRLHIYTIVDAIRDHNVLPFRVDYISTMREAEHIADERVPNIDRERALMAPERIQNIVRYVLDNYDRKTKRNDVYQLKAKRVMGFNSIFCCASVPAAKQYYEAFKNAQASLPATQRLKIGLIYSYGVNEDLDGLIQDENSDDTSALDAASRDFLELAIQDYNAMFGMNFDTSAEQFQNYYKDISQRMKNRELDMLIVVNMFLTGFDATTLNTLWVDKNLRQHGLLQAYSRTNRILNSIKTFGNIVCFRDLEERTNDAISLFGDSEAGGLVLLRSFNDYYLGYDDEKGKHHPGYVDVIAQLHMNYPHADILNMGEEDQKGFIKLFGAVLRSVNVLTTFDQFAGQEVITEADMQDYKSLYLDLKDKYRPSTHDAVDINDDIVFEMELIKQVEINIDYILSLVEKLHDQHLDNKEIRLQIERAVNSSPTLRGKKELIEDFIAQLTPESNVNDEWHTFVQRQQREQLERIIAEENLNHDETIHFMQRAFEEGQVAEEGTDVVKILPPMPLFGKAQERSLKKRNVLDRLKDFFTRFFDISDGIDSTRPIGSSIINP